MKFLVLTILAVLTVGCAAPTAMVNIPNIEKSALLEISDARPEEEKENEMFSFSITSDAYGVYRRGDELINPNPLRIFQHRIHERFLQNETPIKIKVNHFVVYMNLQSELRKGVAGGLLGGVVGAAIASGTQKYGIDGLASLVTQEGFMAIKDEYQRALYTEEENPEKVSVYVVYLDAEIDEKRVFIKVITPTTLPEGNKRHPHVAAVETAISYFLDQHASK